MIGSRKSNANEPENEAAVLVGRSYLMVDYGSSACHATLYDVVEGRYRMIGRGEGLNTVGAPWYDLGFGLTQAIGQISEATGRKLLSLQGELIRPMRGDGSGVDYFGATISFGDPLRVVVAGLLEDVSVASARKVLQSVYSLEVGCLHLEDGLGRPGQIETILTEQPDVVLLVGGSNDGADKLVRELMETIGMALELQSENTRPVILFAGNTKLQEQVVELFSELTELHLADNVRPAYETEALESAIALLAQVYYWQKVEKFAKSGVLADWSNTTPMNSAHAFGGIAEYLAMANRGRVLGIDVGSDQVTLVSAMAGQVDLVVRSDKGLGRPLRNQLPTSNNGTSVGPQADNNPDPSLADYILNKSAHPGLIPMSAQAAKFELALMSGLVQQTVADTAKSWSWPKDGYSPPFQTLLLRGRVFSNAGKKADALLALMDGLGSWGVFRVIADGYGVLPAMGLLAGEDPEMVAQVLGGNDLGIWAWVVSPKGRVKEGETMLTAHIASASANATEVSVLRGDLEIVPVPIGQVIEMKLEPASGIDIGAGPGQSRQVTISDSAIGLVIDCRDKQPQRQGE